MNDLHVIGPEKVSMTVYRKTNGDKLVSQFSSERWFASEEEATDALTRVLRVFSDGGDEVVHTIRLKVEGERG